MLPSVAASLGVDLPADLAVHELAPARRTVVVLVDGMGDRLLRARSGHAPFLRSLLAAGRTVDCGFPSTTATSMGTFGTGRPPGAHGLVGYEVRDPDTGRVFNELSWRDGPPPERWQPGPTLFELAARAGVAVTRVGPGHFDGSGLTQSALRGGAFRAASDLAGGVDATLAALRASPRALVYLYWGELDKVGHVHGPQSWQWGDELEAVDRELSRLARALPSDTALVVTADHGMVHVPMASRIDLAHDDELAVGVQQFGGEPRAPQLYCRPGAASDVAATWRERLGPLAYVLPGEQAVAAGLFGPVVPRVRERIGEVVVVMREPFAVVDSRVHRPAVLGLLGVHGARTPDEIEVPVLHRPAALPSRS